MDTVGEFVRAVGGTRFPSPRIPILARLRLIGRLWERANSIHCYSRAIPARLECRHYIPLPLHGVERAAGRAEDLDAVHVVDAPDKDPAEEGSGQLVGRVRRQTAA